MDKNDSFKFRMFLMRKFKRCTTTNHFIAFILKELMFHNYDKSNYTVSIYANLHTTWTFRAIKINQELFGKKE